MDRMQVCLYYLKYYIGVLEYGLYASMFVLFEVLYWCTRV